MRFFAGFQVTSVINISWGVPISIKDINGTSNSIARSGRQTAFSNLTTDQIKDLLGLRFVNGQIYFIDPAVTAANGSAEPSAILERIHAGYSSKTGRYC